jgi:hypothetical protein
LPVNTTRNEQLAQLTVAPISREDAKRIVTSRHYMRTFPQGAKMYFGVFVAASCVGVCVLGYSSATDAKVQKLVDGLGRHEYLEMQRLWVSDACGHNTESRALSLVMRQLRGAGVRLVVTHAGGCKNDCGIVYQASAWLYFGRSPCRDFYLTTDGEFRNLVAAMRFGRVKTKGRSREDIARELFGAGELVDSWRYLYVYPIDKGIRRRLSKTCEPYPKESARHRFNQAWV